MVNLLKMSFLVISQVLCNKFYRLHQQGAELAVPKKSQL